ncbi:glutathione-disulfide reductase [Luteimonas sp. 50]|uniref:Glutathione-disulfide reductase n=1 Tax=Cognatiluteimonas sedimenti TaxID=2927791 RepID=A0ABT0A2I8_9GAMM|nr:glutathione-disulfide reductase [Lysobacter sedimenti]MCJ0825198.1 glutathione-disulfide reductase [Lysobacter sedimenti]
MSTTPAHGADFDLVVLGGGSGGLAAAFRAAEHGARVALLEPGALGGTCVNVGCVPKKAMWLAADLAQKLVLARQLGFTLADATPVLDWPAFIAHRQRYIGNIHASYQQRLDAAGIALLATRGRLVASDTVACADGVRLRAPQILVATGGRPQRPDIPGADLGMDSDGFFRLVAAPGRVAIIGGGYIAVELAGVLQSLGSRVGLFVRGRGLLRGFDDDLTTQLVEDYRQHGVRAHFGSEVLSVRAQGNARVLRDADGNDSDAFDALVFATGRRPNSDGIGLEEVGVALGPRGHVVVDDFQRTGVAGIHALGDVTDRIELTPVAIAAARRLMDRLFGGQPGARLDYADIATVLFSHPPLGKVGMTEAEARQVHGDAVRVHRAGFRPMLHALADSPQRSLFKLVCVPEGGGEAARNQRVVGIHLLGEGADEILQGFAVALKRGITLADLHDTVAIHPTAAEEVVLMR